MSASPSDVNSHTIYAFPSQQLPPLDDNTRSAMAKLFSEKVDRVDTPSVVDYVSIDMNNISDVPEILKDTSARFGILKIKTKKVEITKKPVFILFTIDRTGSMSDSSGTSGTKIGHLKQTFKNMISYFSKIEGADIFIRVHSFNDKVEYTIETVKITPENVAELTARIDSLSADGLTAIDEALQHANTVMNQYVEANPSHSYVHIFMTDGEASTGLMNPDELTLMVDEKFTNIFVGFGNSHNASLLRKFSEKKSAEYQYIDSAENSVLMYGETIHRFLYPALKDVDIVMTEGTIYDWQTNTWTTQIHESIIIGEMEKVYHIKEAETSMYDMEVAVYGIEATVDSGERILLGSDCSPPPLIDGDTNLPFPVDCTKYMFRQKVQEALYAARTMNDYGVERSVQKEFKKDLADLFRNMRKYIREKGLSADGFMKTLCDDIDILYKSIGAGDGLMFAMSRQASQGRQNTYTPGRIQRCNAMAAPYPTPRRGSLGRTPSIMPLPARLQRSPSVNSSVSPPSLSRTNTRDIEVSFQDTQDFDYATQYESYSDEEPASASTVVPGFDPEDEIEQYVEEYTNTSGYSTAGVMDTIRTMSQV